MLPRRHRLRGSTDIKRVRRDGRNWRHPLAILVVHDNGLDVSRFAFIAGKHLGSAVSRNLVKRRLREAVRSNLGGINEGSDCLLIARTNILSASYSEIEIGVKQLLDRAQLLAGGNRTGIVLPSSDQ